MKIVCGLLLFFGMIAIFIWNSVPRLMSDLWHAREFVPAQNFTITNYKCTNWNGFMFNECTATFVSRQGRESQITDWRFGRAPGGPVQLLQLRDDASSVTTDVSLQTLWNRLVGGSDARAVWRLPCDHAYRESVQGRRRANQRAKRRAKWRARASTHGARHIR